MRKLALPPLFVVKVAIALGAIGALAVGNATLLVSAPFRTPRPPGLSLLLRLCRLFFSQLRSFAKAVFIARRFTPRKGSIRKAADPISLGDACLERSRADCPKPGRESLASDGYVGA